MTTSLKRFVVETVDSITGRTHTGEPLEKQTAEAFAHHVTLQLGFVTTVKPEPPKSVRAVAHSSSGYAI